MRRSRARVHARPPATRWRRLRAAVCGCRRRSWPILLDVAQPIEQLDSCLMHVPAGRLLGDTRSRPDLAKGQILGNAQMKDQPGRWAELLEGGPDESRLLTCLED